MFWVVAHNMSIKILSEVLINRIAAGEVIVRPSSVVKELVENSLDAGATRIFVELTNECRDIRVRDNGCGITSADAPLALVRHATSKLLEFDDLWDLQTRGFRGEALASIAAVSRISVLSRCAAEESGVRMTAEGDATPIVEAAGAPLGTDIRVRDLFFNTPARLKFMKSAASELQQCVSIILRQGLIRPDVSFVVKGPKETLMNVPENQPWNERIASLLGSNVLENLLPVSRDTNGMSVRGFVLSPVYTRKDRRYQYFFVNGRPITSRNLSAVLSTAYRGLVMTQRFPAAVLNIQLPGGEVDVNVHPTKEEVRFKHDNIISGMVYRAALDALTSSGKMPEMSIDSPENVVSVSAAEDKFVLSQPTVQAPLPEQQHLPFQARQFMGSGITEQRTEMPGDFSAYTSMDKEVSAPPQEPTSIHEASSPGNMSILTADGNHPIVLGQVGLCYIVATLGNDLLLVDQHAAHERLIYQRLCSTEAMKSLDSQEMLIPVSVDVPVLSVPYMERICPILNEYGIEIEPFGGTTYLVKSVPANLPDIDVNGLLADLLDDSEQNGKIPELERLRDKVVTRMSCHAAIKAGQPLSQEKMTALLMEMAASEMGFTCPHGRPTVIRLTMDQLDKQFKRKL